MKKTILFILCCMMFMASCGKENTTQQDIKTSKVMRVGRYIGHSRISGTVIIFANGDYLKCLDRFERDSKAEYACALKVGDVVSYIKTKKGIELLRVESFANAQ